MWTKFLKVFFPCLINKPKKLEPFTKPKTEPSVVKKPTIKKKKGEKKETRLNVKK